MPIYEYECRKCGHVFDALQKMSDPQLTDCPDCGAAELRKLLSAPNFRLKGGGWYETDFKDKNKRNLVDGGEAKSTSASADAGESKTGGAKAGAAPSESPGKATKLGGSSSSSAKSD